MWSPTHVQVTVQRARQLVTKNKHGVFTTIALGKDKYQTSLKERTEKDEYEWREKCELKIPSQGNTACIVLTVLSPNLLGTDTFLGCVSIPLAELDVYDRPKSKWYELQDRGGRPKHKERGQLEVKIGFSVRPGSVGDVSKKDLRSSLGQLSQVAHNVGGSLASIGSVDKKSLKKLAHTISKKMKKEKPVETVARSSPNVLKKSAANGASGQVTGDADPGVISDDEFAFDDLSHTGSGCSLEAAHASRSVTGSVETVGSSDLPLQASMASLAASTTHIPSASPVAPSSASRRDKGAAKFNTLPSSKPPRSITPVQEKLAHRWEQKLQEARLAQAALASSERIVVGGEAKSASPVGGLSPEVMRLYESKSRDDLIEMVEQLRNHLNKARKERRDLEDYIDDLLLRVMEHSPNILQNPYGS